MTAFPAFISLTITNACNLRCRMCGQWSEHGYIANPSKTIRPQMELRHWKRLADESADHGIKMILIRGGEPFLYPDIIPLLEHLHARGIFVERFPS